MRAQAMLTRLLRLFGLHLDTPDVVIVPTSVWQRALDDRDRAERRVRDLERQVAAMEQGR